MTIEPAEFFELHGFAREALRQFLAAGAEFGRYVGAELKLEAERPACKLAAIQRLMLELNTLTGGPHSATSAERIVETDPAYAAHLETQRQTVVGKNNAATVMESARLRAELLIAVIRAYPSLPEAESLPEFATPAAGTDWEAVARELADKYVVDGQGAPDFLDTVVRNTKGTDL